MRYQAALHPEEALLLYQHGVSVKEKDGGKTGVCGGGLGVAVVGVFRESGRLGFRRSCA